jgi:hypothetical protein
MKKAEQTPSKLDVFRERIDPRQVYSRGLEAQRLFRKRQEEGGRPDTKTEKQP